MKETRHKNEKMTLRRQMAVEEDERQHIEELKTEEKEEAERSVYEQFSKLKQDQVTQEQRQKEKAQKKNLIIAGSTAKSTVTAASTSSSVSPASTVPIATTTSTVSTPPTATAMAPAPAPATATASARTTTETTETTTTTTTTANSSIWSDDEDDDKEVQQQQQQQEDDLVVVHASAFEDDEEEIVFVPNPRETSTIKIEFTERFFPTPARESKLQEENDWLAKNGAHVGKRWGQKRDDPGTGDARDISERDPMWLKGKGDDFYRAKDFQSAANAYTAAIAVDKEDPMVPALSNRAACYLRMGKYTMCRADCTRVIECLPPVPNSAASGQLNPRELRKAQLGTRSRILVRRGAASCELGEYSLAVVDYEEAISILLLDQEAVTGGPSGAQLTAEAIDVAKQQIHALHADLKRIRNLVECSNLKEAGDAALRRKDVEQAIQSYTQAVQLDASFVSALSNRSAAYLVQGNWESAIDDCTLALKHLKGGGSNDNTPVGAVPRGGSSRHASFTAKTLARRATAFCKTGCFNKAVEDLQSALVLDKTNVKLIGDLKRIQEQIKVTNNGEEKDADEKGVKEETSTVGT